MGCGYTYSLVDVILKHTFGNQSTHRQKRQKMSPNRNQNALEAIKNLPCDRNVQYVQGIQWRGVSKPAHHCQLWVVFHLLVLQEM